MISLGLFIVLISLIGNICSFKIGTKYIYDFQNTIELDGTETNEGPKYVIRAILQFNPVWENPRNNDEQLIKVELLQPHLRIWKKGNWIKQASSLDASKSVTIFVNIANGEDKTSFQNPEQDQILRNVLRNVMNLLKYRSKDQVSSQIDGKCQVLSHDEGDTQVIKKQCDYSIEPERHIHYVQRTNLHRKTQEEFRILMQPRQITFQSVDITETIRMFSHIWRNDVLFVKSNIQMKFINEENGLITVTSDNVQSALGLLSETNNFLEIAHSLSSHSLPVNSNCDLIKIIKSYKKYLSAENLSKMSSLSAFSKLLKCVRTASKTDIESVLTEKGFKEIMPQILDVIGFSGTKDAFDAAFSVLKFTNSALVERYLLALSMSANPTEHMVHSIIELLKSINDGKIKASEETLATLTTTLGALTKSLSSAVEGDHQITKTVEEYFETSLSSCKTESCTLMNLRGLRNAALRSSEAILMSIADKGGKCGYEALLALKDIGFHRSTNCEPFTEKIFFEMRKFEDTSNRIVAAELLLECRSNARTLKQLLAKLADQNQYELSTFLASIIEHKMEKDAKFRNDIVSTLKDPDVKQYYVLAQRGNSVLFQNPVLPFADVSSVVNTSYDARIELLSGGMVKNFAVDVNINSPEGSLPVISVGASTSGMDSFSGSSSEDPDAVPTAALHLSVLGLTLRPKVLFSGTSNLMGLVFSGAGSEKTPILQGNYVAIDFSEEVFLQSGLPVTMSVKSMISNDLSGSIQISLWNRNSQSQIMDSFATMLKGSLSIKTNFANLENEFLVKTESTVTIQSNLEFYEEPYKMCTQVTHPDSVLSSHRKMSLTIPNQKAVRKIVKKRSWTYPSRSYLLHKKNSEMCAALHNAYD